MENTIRNVNTVEILTTKWDKYGPDDPLGS